MTQHKLGSKSRQAIHTKTNNKYRKSLQTTHSIQEVTTNSKLGSHITFNHYIDIKGKRITLHRERHQRKTHCISTLDRERHQRKTLLKSNHPTIDRKPNHTTDRK